MADQQAGTSVISTVKDKAKEAIKTVTPTRLGDFTVVGKWFANKGNPSIFTLTAGGKGVETLVEADSDGKEITVEVDWWMKGDYLILTCHASDRDYEHWIVPGTYERGSLQGQSDSGELFRFYPLR